MHEEPVRRGGGPKLPGSVSPAGTTTSKSRPDANGVAGAQRCL